MSIVNKVCPAQELFDVLTNDTPLFEFECKVIMSYLPAADQPIEPIFLRFNNPPSFVVGRPWLVNDASYCWVEKALTNMLQVGRFSLSVKILDFLSKSNRTLNQCKKCRRIGTTADKSPVCTVCEMWFRGDQRMEILRAVVTDSFWTLPNPLANYFSDLHARGYTNRYNLDMTKLSVKEKHRIYKSRRLNINSEYPIITPLQNLVNTYVNQHAPYRDVGLDRGTVVHSYTGTGNAYTRTYNNRNLTEEWGDFSSSDEWDPQNDNVFFNVEPPIRVTPLTDIQRNDSFRRNLNNSNAQLLDFGTPSPLKTLDELMSDAPSPPPLEELDNTNLDITLQSPPIPPPLEPLSPMQLDELYPGVNVLLADIAKRHGNLNQDDSDGDTDMQDIN